MFKQAITPIKPSLSQAKMPYAAVDTKPTLVEPWCAKPSGNTYFPPGQAMHTPCQCSRTTHGDTVKGSSKISGVR